MTKADVRREFDAIVDFAELPHVLDTPVKMYSSGMQLRWVRDRVTSRSRSIRGGRGARRGDAAFQVKCVERMTRLVREAARCCSCRTICRSSRRPAAKGLSC
jgi:lipopolysaccharide transport system ATP-binding protein